VGKREVCWGEKGKEKDDVLGEYSGGIRLLHSRKGTLEKQKVLITPTSKNVGPLGGTSTAHVSDHPHAEAKKVGPNLTKNQPNKRNSYPKKP